MSIAVDFCCIQTYYRYAVIKLHWNDICRQTLIMSGCIDERWRSGFADLQAKLALPGIRQSYFPLSNISPSGAIGL
jgi:hypothetical protein